MRQKNRFRRRPLRLFERWGSPVVFGLATWLAFPSLPAYADLAGLLSGMDRGEARWRMVLTESPAGSIHESELTFVDPIITGPVGRSAGMTLADGSKVAFNSAQKSGEESPDEDRVNRKDKKGRIVAVEIIQPPKAFSAGSVLDRTSSLLAPRFDNPERYAFVKPEIKGREIEVATAFYKKRPEIADPGVPAFLAKLVTNKSADVLATAYAPAQPDYARVSPFDSILKKDGGEGRFVPSIGPQDHAWAAAVLPPSVFSPAEQQCLASGVYFEARGESVKGQAAVAQVILNRVRNPAYPKTICGVVYQNEDWRNACQFSFACDNIKDRVNSKHHWKVAREVAMAVTAGKIWLPEVGSSTHYHALYVRPKWASTMKKVGRIGLHVFYRTYGGGWI
ncbi:cell wall hydrolase [Rhizobiaceae bacterium n13]|uniref:Cell wall hydrolase n=1 Tax=Ferirhizobium litorale TaxID=2927786 RepID=A0AAE3QCY5_9HYPH|nr:cell wall hydrolase [Fererhizobium litorale]MDI7861514.1 cell wall hydrolase [Fererhizobium litorale]MDI7921660.1 cell wall hydrolase [Fererhizobium litorale]